MIPSYGEDLDQYLVAMASRSDNRVYLHRDHPLLSLRVIDLWGVAVITNRYPQRAAAFQIVQQRACLIVAALHISRVLRQHVICDLEMLITTSCGATLAVFGRDLDDLNPGMDDCLWREWI